MTSKVDKSGNSTFSGCGCLAAIIAGVFSILWFPVCCVVLGNVVSCIHKSPERSEVDEEKTFVNKALPTGSKPYSDYYPYEKCGSNKISFKTSKGCDYVIIVKDTCGMVVNHAYIKGGDTFMLGVPNGGFNVFFYTGRGWNPDLPIHDVYGRFTEHENLQKDGPIQLINRNVQYTLYPVVDGNLKLQQTSISDAF